MDILNILKQNAYAKEDIWSKKILNLTLLQIFYTKNEFFFLK